MNSGEGIKCCEEVPDDAKVARKTRSVLWDLAGLNLVSLTSGVAFVEVFVHLNMDSDDAVIVVFSLLALSIIPSMIAFILGMYARTVYDCIYTCGADTFTLYQFKRNIILVLK